MTQITDFSYGVIPFMKTSKGIEFLVIKNKIGGQRSFPKGHKEEGETDIQSAKREFQEEVGVQDIELHDTYIFQEKYSFVENGTTIHKTVHYYLGEMSTHQHIHIQPSEIDAYYLGSYPDIRNTITHENTKEILDQAFTLLSKNEKD